MAEKSSAKKKDKKGTELALYNAALEIPDDQIPDTVEGIAEWINENKKGVQKVALVYWWNIGKMISRIQEDEGKYGSKAVERVAEAQGKAGPRLLYNAHNFYKDHPTFQDIETRAIEWSSIREIQRIPDPQQRLLLEERAEAENMTVREVKEAVNEVKGKNKPKDKAPKSSGPNALSYFMKMDRVLDKAISSVDDVLKDLGPMLELVGDEDRTPDEDYNAIVEGDESKGKDPMAVIVSGKADTLREKLEHYIIPLKDTFSEGEETTNAEGAEEAE